MARSDFKRLSRFFV